MAYSVETRASNPANALRDALDKAEREVVAPEAGTIEEFLISLDQIEQMFADLSRNQIDLRPEEARWQSLLNRISSQPAPLTRAAARAGGLTRLRARHPPAQSFWWRLDAEVTRRRLQTIRRIALMLLIIATVLTGAPWAIDKLFPPDPETVLLVGATGDIEQLILEQKWEEALQVVEETRRQLPDEPELMIWEGILAEQIGDATRAATALAQAQERLADQPTLFWLTLGNYRLQVGDLDGAETAAQKAVELDPQEAQAYFLLGGIAETRGDVPTALEMFDKTFDLAEADNPQLAVIAKVRFGQLLQRPAPLPTSAETPAATTTPAP
jgi:tetratricopeptide (TPR) repeat protein